jgi:uncharacterized protein (TIGR03435 family)
MKPTAAGVVMGRTQFQPAGFLSTNVWLKLAIQIAYSVHDYQVTGGPAWLDSERFDIQARAATRASRDDIRLMLQTLLAERCHLQLHRETRTLPVYSLEVSKGGLKIRALPDGEPGRNCGMGTDKNGLFACGAEMGDFAFFLNNLLHVPVLDHTELAGKFDLRADFDIADLAGTTAPPDTNRPPLIPALAEQLGLKLVAQKAPIEILVIDSAERPSAN